MKAGMDSGQSGWTARRTALFLITAEAVVLAAVVWLRGLHPPGHDELNFLETGLRMLGSKGNPKAFNHGSFLFDLMATLHALLFLGWGLTGHGWDTGGYLEAYLRHRELFLLAGRLLVASFGVVLLLALHRLAVMLYSERAGALTVGLLSLGVLLPFTGTSLKEDVPAAALAVLSVLVLYDDSLKRDPWKRWMLAGILCGAAAATRYTLASLALIPAILAFGGAAPLTRLAAFLLGAAGAFLVIEPYIVLDIPSVLASVQAVQAQFAAGDIARHMAPRYLQDYLPLGLGILLACGAAATVIRAAVGSDIRLKAIAAYLVALTAVFMWATSGVPRYLIALAPFAALLVAGEVSRWTAAWDRRGLATAGAALLLTCPANLLSAKFTLLLASPDTRTLAQSWIERHVPDGSTVLLEGTVSHEPTFAPSLLPSAAWLEAKQREAHLAGTSGLVLQASAANAARSRRPRYHLLETGVEEWDGRDADYVVLSSYSALPTEFYRRVRENDPNIARLLSARQAGLERLHPRFTRLALFAPYPDLRFDWFDNPDLWTLLSAPLDTYDQWIAGPRIEIYRRAQEPAIEETPGGQGSRHP